MTGSASTVPSDYDSVHVAADGYVDTLIDELRHYGAQVTGVVERLVFACDMSGPAAWANNSWLSPREIVIDSIGDGAKALRGLQRNWALYSVAHHRRAHLIERRLPAIRFRPLVFPITPPAAPLGAWTLIARDRIIASTECSSAFAGGVACFAEDRQGPPNRAYLKLWEALTLARRWPQPGDRCLDLGAAPGGWSWVLAQLGARVLAVDRAVLAPAVAADPLVEHRPGDAFALGYEDTGGFDWICSDLIAYPERLLDLARYWAQACPQAGIILTVKCQGPVDAALMIRFLEIPGARLAHLSANKHELTWFRLPWGGPPEAASFP